MPDRKTPPPVRIPRVPKLPPAERWTLGNGLKVIAVPGVDAPVLNVEMIWDAGRPYEHKPLADSLTNELLTEGTRHRSAADLEDYFEGYGTSLRRPQYLDTGNLSLSTILRLADRTLPVMAEVIAEPALTQAHLDRLLRLRRQRLRENLEDPDTLAYRLITEAAFGPRTPYGYNGYRDTYAAVSLEDIQRHYRERYRVDTATLFVTGKITGQVTTLLEETFGQVRNDAIPPPDRNGRIHSTDGTVGRMYPAATARVLQHRRPRAGQTMIRRGRAGIRITDDDFPGLFVLDTIFGGYFGSRLMQNIREDKGYTYGIDSDIDTYRFDGSFGVSADVANENLDAVRREILTEMDKLRQHPVPARELDMVRRYLTGSLVADMDGPLAASGRYHAAVIKRYDAEWHLDRIAATIRDISAAEIQDLAQRYLRPELDWEVIVGGAPYLPEAERITVTDRPLFSTGN